MKSLKKSNDGKSMSETWQLILKAPNDMGLTLRPEGPILPSKLMLIFYLLTAFILMVNQ